MNSYGGLGNSSILDVGSFFLVRKKYHKALSEVS